jgi:phosphate-selective porin OprO and OprP
MSSRWNRPALGGALVVALILGVNFAARGQFPQSYPPAYPPPASPTAPTLPTPPIFPAPLAPPTPNVPVAPTQQQPMYAPGVPYAPPNVLYIPVAYPVGALPMQPGMMPVGSPGMYQAQPGVPMPMPMPMPFGMGDMPTTTVVNDPPPAPPDKPIFDIDWQNGVFFQTANKNFSFHAGGAFQYDFAWYSATPVLELAKKGGIGQFNDGANVRRGRIFFEGTLYQAVDYKFEMEFFNGVGFSPVGTTAPVNSSSVVNSPGPTDAWINIKDVPFFGNVRIGNQKEWFSLEHLTNYRYQEFMEPSYLYDFAQMDRFNNGYSPGISVFRTWLDARVFSGIGMYKNESDLIGFGLGDGQYAVTGRLAALPIWNPDQQSFWSIGGAMSHRDPVTGQVVINVRDNVRNAPFPLLNLLINTGNLNSTAQDLFNFETAAVAGPFTLQAEYTANVVRGASVAATTTTPAGPVLGDLFFQGCYVEGLVLLTGESRTWNTSLFVFNRVIPKHPLRLTHLDEGGSGFGAWELGVRYTYLDVSNKAVQAGRLDSVTIGLNWYLNANAKIQWNYDYTQRGDTNNPAQGHIHAFGMRTAFDF